MTQSKIKFKYFIYPLLGAAACFFTYTLHVIPIQSGLDSSWIYAMNRLNNDPAFIFGRDILFTLGPLSFLLRTLPVGNNILFSVLFWSLIHLLFHATTLRFALRRSRLPNYIGFLCAYLAAFYLLNLTNLEYLLIITPIFFCAISARKQIMRPAAVFCLSLLSVFCFQIKSLFGLTVFSALISTLLLLYRKNPIKIIRTLPALFAGALTAVLISIYLWYKTPAYFLKWLLHVIAYSAAYPVAMSQAGPPAVLTAALLLCCMAFAILRLSSHPRLSSYAQVILIALLPGYFIFKHGFIRQDLHVAGFFQYVLLLIAILFLFARRKREFFLNSIFFTGALLACLTVYREYPGISIPPHSWKEAASTIRLAFSPKKIHNILESAAQSFYQKQTVPPHWKPILSQPSTTVDIRPYELSYLAANPWLKWAPNPTLQSQASYNAYFDRLSALHYSTAQAADYLIAEFRAIGNGHPFLESPLTWQYITHYYQLIEHIPEKNLFLLQRKPNLPSPDLRKTGRSENTSWDIWREIPEHSGILSGKISIRLNLIGKLMTFLLRAPECYLEVEYADGIIQKYHFIFPVAANGLWINPLPRNWKEFEMTLKGEPITPVKRFRLSSSHKTLFQDPVVLEWQELITSE